MVLLKLLSGQLTQQILLCISFQQFAQMTSSHSSATFSRLKKALFSVTLSTVSAVTKISSSTSSQCFSTNTHLYTTSMLRQTFQRLMLLPRILSLTKTLLRQFRQSTALYPQLSVSSLRMQIHSQVLSKTLLQAQTSATFS